MEIPDKDIDKVKKILKQVAAKIVKKRINAALENNVVPVVKRVMQEQISEQVYKKTFVNQGNIYASFEFINSENFKVTFDESGLSFKIINITKPKSVFNTPIKSSFEGIFGYWIEMGRVPIFWGPDCEDYVNGQSTVEWLKSGAKSNFLLSGNKYSIFHKGKLYGRYLPPRPWAKNTKRYLKSEFGKDRILIALKKGLEAQGLIKKEKKKK